MDADLRLSFIVCLSLSAVLMKITSVKIAKKPERQEVLKFAFTPLVSILAWGACPPTSWVLLKEVVFKVVLNSVILILVFLLYWKAIELGNPSPVFISYLAIFPALMLGETLGPLLQLFYSPLGRIITLHHRSPILMKSIGDFWGARWNRWISDWFNQVIFNSLSKKPLFATFCVFLFSGIWHELVINVPAHYLYGMNFLGGMLLYFLIQYTGLMIERKFLKRKVVIKRAFAWIVVIAPAPLILNEIILRIVFLWPYF